MFPNNSNAQKTPTELGMELVTFASGNLQLQGFLHKPVSAGPFPAVLLNHGSEPLPGPMVGMAEPFMQRGYVVFVPHRRGQGRSREQGSYIIDLLEQTPVRRRGQQMVELQDLHQQDVVAAMAHLKQLPYVDQHRIVMAGCSFGGIQTVLAIEKDLGLKAAIAFAPAAMTWSKFPELRQRMIAAAQSATVPLLLVQAQNDYDLRPTQALAEVMTKAQKPHQRLIFPAFGNSPEQGHRFCGLGAAIWSEPVFKFLYRI